MQAAGHILVRGDESAMQWKVVQLTIRVPLWVIFNAKIVLRLLKGEPVWLMSVWTYLMTWEGKVEGLNRQRGRDACHWKVSGKPSTKHKVRPVHHCSYVVQGIDWQLRWHDGDFCSVNICRFFIRSHISIVSPSLIPSTTASAVSRTKEPLGPFLHQVLDNAGLVAIGRGAACYDIRQYHELNIGWSRLHSRGSELRVLIVCMYMFLMYTSDQPQASSTLGCTSTHIISSDCSFTNPIHHFSQDDASFSVWTNTMMGP